MIVSLNRSLAHKLNRCPAHGTLTKFENSPTALLILAPESHEMPNIDSYILNSSIISFDFLLRNSEVFDSLV